MPCEHDHPTFWEKLRDNLTPLIAVAIAALIWNMHTDQVRSNAEITSTLQSLDHRVGRLETRLDRLIENGNGAENR